MASHSSIVGGSTAARLLNCPGSYQATLALPKSADISSEYADEGTAMHDVMTRIFRTRAAAESRGLTPDAYVFNPFLEARKWKGQHFYDRVLTQAHLDEMIEPALVHLAVLEKEWGGGFRVMGVELRVAFPGIPGSFGTCDLVLVNEQVVLHVDWKFGQGVGVKAVYTDREGSTVNAQLLYYAAGAKATIKGLYKGKSSIPVLAIIQPRSDTPLTHVGISRKELTWFVEDLQKAVVYALDRDPVRSKGEHCRFAPCKVDCPLWTNAVLDLTAIGKPPANNTPNKVVTPYGEYLSKSKVLVDVLAMFSKEVNDQLHAYLEAGGLVPGWRLKAKTKQRQWVDDLVVDKALTKLGFEIDEIYDSKLVTFAKADATARKRGVKIPDHLRVAPATTETTVTSTDDPAPVVDRIGAAEAFKTALKAIAAK